MTLLFKMMMIKIKMMLIKKLLIMKLLLECHYRELKNHYLLCVTETISKDDMDRLVDAISRCYKKIN